jgi:hypothetical protein
MKAGQAFPHRKVPDDAVLDAYARYPANLSAGAKEIGLTRASYKARLATLERRGCLPSFTVSEAPPTLDEPLEDLIARRVRDSGRVKDRLDHGEMHTVAIHERGPVGILHVGDPHVDDAGCNFALLWQHLQLVLETPGLYCGILGDCQNNWVGRLARLYSVQSVSSRDSWRLVEAMIAKVAQRLVYLVGGNHDMWSGAGDPLQWIMREHHGLMQAHGVRIKFAFPGGESVRMTARHDFPGQSQFNPAFGQGKAAYQGAEDHILISGHRHNSGYMTYYNPHTGILSHCCQVGSYKMIDDYAAERGFLRNNLTPSVLTILDPFAEHEAERVLVFQSVELGARVLTAMRATLSAKTTGAGGQIRQARKAAGA